ncbi:MULTISPECIES: ABC transporter ATP-binding protein [unclassified Bacillus (in: firmicutes)]|uniref:ABC transporter ATP-binding protein n=1 Tax=unclassified Bacillus (in: firmicutes) TaxID=185979 RepID=UPI0008EB2C8E|nr:MULTISPECIES: ABC transporter ATP-binding protein [unclassified Bacillus (in: firmicutes)]SFB06484.1 ABC-2 type transport system ATP-binding protein [Bacillus sp. UNCCL13]SFQ87662.1 ABC-2 type transport system ATP-binding protein [Bacillus sp. cl95]
MNQYVIETKEVEKRFGSFLAVDHVNLQVPKGGIYGFLGPNGAGKSTTIRMLLGLIQPTSGRVEVFGKDIRKERLAILKKVGSMVESPSYYGHLTAYENLEITRKILKADKKEIARVLDIVRLNDVKNKAVKKFSLGMKQRLGIAQALLGKPELLILDEPTNGLDPAGILEIRSLIKSLPEHFGMTVLISSHILTEIEHIATHVGIINKGKLMFQGSLAQLQNRQVEEIKLDVSEKEKAFHYLSDLGYGVTVSQDHLLLKKPVDHSSAEINRKLVMEGFDVNQIIMEKSTLEDIFLQMTGKGA